MSTHATTRVIAFEAPQQNSRSQGPAMNKNLAHAGDEIVPAAAISAEGRGLRRSAVGVLVLLIMLLMSWTSTPTQANAATALPKHGWTGMEYCLSLDSFWLSSIYAFRSDPTKPEYVYWTGTLQKWNGAGWSNVVGSTVPWQRFTAAYKSADGSVQWGALIGGASPTWSIKSAGYYRVTNKFYWSRTGRYSKWEPTNSCYFNPPNWG